MSLTKPQLKDSSVLFIGAKQSLLCTFAWLMSLQPVVQTKGDRLTDELLRERDTRKKTALILQMEDLDKNEISIQKQERLKKTLLQWYRDEQSFFLFACPYIFLCLLLDNNRKLFWIKNRLID